MDPKVGVVAELRLRPGTPEDADACGRICYEAFRAIAEQHNFPPDFPSAEVAIGLVEMLLAHPGFHSVVAELDGRVVGSNFLDERSAIAGVGPITVDPQVQNRGIGCRLMLGVMERAQQRNVPGVRLLQAAYHTRSLSLYAKLGFEVQEVLAVMQGPPLTQPFPGYIVRTASEDELAACNRLCRSVHGHDRSGEIHDAITQGAAKVVERNGRISGYTTGIAFFAHSVGETNDDLMALIASATEFTGPGFLVPVTNGPLFRWCLAHGLRAVFVMTLMTVGLYNQPTGGFLPSVLY